MNPTLNFTEIDQIKHYSHQHDIRYIKFALTDLNGILRGKTINIKKFFSILDNGGSFYDGILAGDIQDALLDNIHFTGAHTGYPDAPITVILDSARMIPWENNSLFFLCDFMGEASNIAPRTILQKVIAQAKDMGFTLYAGSEYEFTVFAENEKTIREKKYQELIPFTVAGTGYSTEYMTTYHDLHEELLSMCESMEMPLETIHTEIGPGMLEAALSAQPDLKAADNAVLFKSFCKSFFARKGLLASFMAKWNPDVQGHGMHIHLSLLDKNDKNLFYDANDQHGMSQIMKHFLAGQQYYMAELLSMCAPTINSYARYVPGCWAPTEAIWGFENRAVSLRVIQGGHKGQRIEYRIPGADCNPYLAYAAALGSGLLGIEEKLPLDKPYDLNQPKLSLKHQLPHSLFDASKAFAASSAAKKLFGTAFVTDYAASRDWEARQYQKAVTDWQLYRYLERV